MAESMKPATYCENITDCPICKETLQDPRILPCIHTFCLRCIETVDIDKQPGDELACPLCEKHVRIPEGGFSNFPRNFFVDKLLDVKRLVSSLPVCDVCDESCKPPAADSVATVYCTECQQHLCQQCTGIHKKIKCTSSHHLSDVSDHAKLREMLSSTVTGKVCNTHEKECLTLYCYDCNMSLCTVCQAESHNEHKCSDLEELTSKLGVEIMDDVTDVKAKLVECDRLLIELRKAAERSAERRAKVKNEICQKADELKQLIEDHKMSLLDELSSDGIQDDERLMVVRANIEFNKKMLESFNKYSTELANYRFTGDLMKAASELHSRADELRELNLRETSGIDSYRAIVSVCFRSRNPVGDEMTKLFGHLDKDGDKSDNFPDKIDVTHVLAPQYDKPVCSVTSLGNELFIVRSGIRQLEMYDASTFKFQHNYSFSRYSYGQTTSGLSACAACEINRCVYVADADDLVIHRMQLFDNSISKWSTSYTPNTMSLTSSHNLLVMMLAQVPVLHEFNTRGQFIRDISLAAVTGRPDYMCALHSSDISFGVTHFAWSHSNFSIIGANGQLVRSYGIFCGSGPGQLNEPRGIAVNKRGFVLIADYGNGRIVVLNTETFTSRVLALSSGSLKRPYSLWLDQTHDRLYVGEFSGRVLVVDKVNELHFD